MDMKNDIHELNTNELSAVSGGRLNLADLPGFHPTYRTPGSNPSSPLFGNGSYHDTIDNVDGLP
jgi:bacteriocin-like protein